MATSTPGLMHKMKQTSFVIWLCYAAYLSSGALFKHIKIDSVDASSNYLVT